MVNIMKVKLIQVTQNPIDVMWTAARTCYSQKSPIEMWDETRDEPKEEYKEEIENKRWKLVKKVLDSGHSSIAEHVYFTFAIEGVSRALLAQITRHRAGIVFSVMSQRYVEIKERYEDIRDLVVSIDPMCEYFDEIKCDKYEKELIKILEKYFVDVNENTVIGYGQALMHYLRAIDHDEKPEDARRYLPNATKTNITMSVNYRELMHLFNLRSCCFDNKTEVLTTDGWKFFKDLNGDETFYSLNLDTMEGEYVKSKNFFDYNYDGEMVNVDSQSISLCTTPNHKMLCSYSYDNKKFILDECSNYDKHKRVLMKKNCKEIKGLKPEYFILKGYDREDANQHTSWIEKIPDKQVPIKEFLQVLGFYISDGCATKAGYHYNVVFSKGDKEKLLKYRDLLSKLTNNKIRIYEDRSAWKLEVHDRQLYSYFKALGKVLDKHIPNELFNLDSSLLYYLFKGLMDGDANKQGTTYWTASKQLKDDFQRLCLHIGYSATVSSIDKRGIERVIKTGNKEHIISQKNIAYCISINKSKNEPIIKTTNRDAFSKTYYKGHVYCVELERNNILYVRRNNKCVWSGNSRAQREIRDLFKLIKKEVERVEPRLAEYLVPSCEANGGICFEGQCCGRKPRLSEIMNTYKITHDEIISQEDFNQLMEDIKNPKVNKNLKKLLEMPSIFEDNKNGF